mgnify:CR=1 FL=1
MTIPTMPMATVTAIYPVLRLQAGAYYCFLPLCCQPDFVRKALGGDGRL